MEGRLGRFIDRIKGNKVKHTEPQAAKRFYPWPTLEKIRQRRIEQAPENERRRKELRKRVRYANEEELHLVIGPDPSGRSRSWKIKYK